MYAAGAEAVAGTTAPSTAAGSTDGAGPGAASAGTAVCAEYTLML